MATHPGKLLIDNAQVYTSRGRIENGWLLTDGSTIWAFGPGTPPAFESWQVTQRIDAKNNKLLPGFVDLHVHGAVGFEVMDASPSGLTEMGRFYAQHGVTSFLATTWTATREDTLHALEAVESVRGKVAGGAVVLGAHLEGPYLNPKKCGAQDVRLIRRADPDEAREFLETGVIRLLALAPEYEENLWLIDECVKRGITVSAAHTEAGIDEIKRAVERGLKHATHCFNAMTGFNHRQPGTVGAVLAFAQISCELIADNIHVHPVAQKILMDVKGPSGVILVTDAIRGAGFPDGDYRIDTRIVSIRAGEVRLPDGTIAGSVLTMDRALKNMLSASRRPLEDIWVVSSRNAAEAIGIAARKGSIEVGKDADLVLIDEACQVLMTLVEGRIVYQGAICSTDIS